jgi:hypothetical protein
VASVDKYIQVSQEILLIYTYDDTNLISDSYNILVNSSVSTAPTYGYVAGDTSNTNNTVTNSLFTLDNVMNKDGLVSNFSLYPFLQLKNYSASVPLRHDRLKVMLPVNYVFNGNIGFNLQIYTFDYNNQNQYTIANVYFDITNFGQKGMLNYASPSILFNEKLYGKYIEFDIPAISVVSNQRTGNGATPNTLNSNLTNGTGLSINSPIFIQFSFIQTAIIINNVTTYQLANPITVSLPQSPEFETLGLVVQPSAQGDFFEIFGTFNGTIGGFSDFMNNSVSIGKRYYVQYKISTFEQNILTNSITTIVNDNFGVAFEHRPIFRTTTTTGVLEVEMQIIDAVDGSAILRTASYGMLQNEVSKYGNYLTKINVSSANNPVIYNIKNPFTNNLFGTGGASTLLSDYLQLNKTNNVVVEPVNVPFAVFYDRYNVIAKSDSIKVQNTLFYGLGKLQLLIYPFDNVIKIIIAQQITATQVQYLDLSNASNLKLVFKNSQKSVESVIYNTPEVNLKLGVTIFKIDQSNINDIRNIYESGINIFYITTSNNGITTIIYSGTFLMFDGVNNVNQINNDVKTQQSDTAANQPQVILDTAVKPGTAIVTRLVTPSQVATVPVKNKPVTPTAPAPASNTLAGNTVVKTTPQTNSSNAPSTGGTGGIRNKPAL